MSPVPTSAWRAVESILILIVVSCSIYAGSVAVRAAAAERAAAGRAGGFPTSPPDKSEGGEVKEKLVGSANGEVMGRLRIPLLRLDVPIMLNDGAGNLLQGVGHVPGTAMPGGLGTVGLAGHRDTYFRSLRGIKHDMDIQVSDKTGTYHYAVDSTEIVMPDAVRVLDMQVRPELTLITCYPFNYIGAAPKRFIVHAHLISALPDEL